MEVQIMHTGRRAHRRGIELSTEQPNRVLDYYLHTGQAPDNDRGVLITYGVEVCLCDGEGCVIEAAAYPDIGADRECVISLLEMLIRCTVTPICLGEVLEDLLA